MLHRCCDTEKLVAGTAANVIGEIGINISIFFKEMVLGAIDPGIFSSFINEITLESEKAALIDIKSNPGASPIHILHQFQPLSYCELAFYLITRFIVGLMRSVKNNNEQNQVLCCGKELLKFIKCDENTLKLFSKLQADCSKLNYDNKKFDSLIHNKVVKCVANNSDDGTIGLHFWNRFSEDVRSVCSLCISSAYAYKLKLSEIHEVVFLSVIFFINFRSIPFLRHF